MLNILFNWVAPHSCCSCGAISSILCDNCKYNIVFESANSCFFCKRPTVVDGVCKNCPAPYQRIWCVGEYTEELKKVVHAMKFGPARQASDVLAELLCERIGSLPKETVVVPVPTVKAHVRQRGFDHADRMARRIAKIQGCQYKSLLRRTTSTSQRGAGREERLKNAASAFESRKPLDIHVPHLIVDDVMTTGASLRQATAKIAEAGVKEIWAAVAAYRT